MPRRGSPAYQPGESGTATSLTLSGNEITDAVRAAGAQGDGLAPEGSMGIWEATTNLITNGGMETNDTGWTDVSATGSRVTSQYKFGAASLEVVTGNAAANEGCYHNFAATAAAYTVSAWVRGPGGGTVRMAVRDNAGGSPQTGSAVTLSSSWQRISLTTTALSSATWRCYVETDSQQSITFQVDGVQVEQQPLATPYVETDGGTASRSAGRVQVPVAAVLDETQGWVAIRFRSGWGNSSEPVGGSGFLSWFDWRDNSTTRLAFAYRESTNTLYHYRKNAGTGAEGNGPALALSVGDAATAIMSWTATQIASSANGSVFTTQAAGTGIPALAATQFDVGGEAHNADDDVFWFACGLGTLTDADAANIHAWGSPDPAPGLFPTAADLTMIWRAIDGAARTY